jgi:ATP-dependent DNA helicase RecG
MLTMSATPIPRTLAMTKFGEMALSVIDEKPAGRLPIITTVCSVDEHDLAYEAMCDEIKRGGQAYVILRLVNESQAQTLSDVKGAEEEYARLVSKYPNVKFGVLHGQLSADEKAMALDKFTRGEIQALVATSVVEVGVDVPNASVIIIEDADGFGLAALHQLRGRVGRGERQSKCFLLHSPGGGENAELKGDRARDRLRVLEQSNNGFRIAESDLQLRGAGELFGTKQSGQQVNLFHASMSTDLYLLEAARKAAAEMISRALLQEEPLPAPIKVALEKHPALILDNAVAATTASTTTAATN